MESIRQPPRRHFFAVVLVRDHEDAEEARVLLPNAMYDDFPSLSKEEFVYADNLGRAAKARAQNKLEREVDEIALVYAENPTYTEPRDLTYRASVRLNHGRQALNGSDKLGLAECQNVQEYYVLVTLRTQQGVEETKGAEFAQSDDAKFLSICEEVRSAVDTCSYQLPAVFRLPVDHPFASTVNQRSIPCHPKDHSRPLLLMEGLAPALSAPVDGSGILVEPIRLIPDDEKHALRKRMRSHPSVLFGVSGAGKTQLLCEMLAENFGLLFVASRGGNGGCADLEKALGSLLDGVSAVPVSAVDDASRQTLENNLRVARRIFQGVVLARLLLLRALRQKFGDELHPGVWLWMQLYPDALFEASPKVAELFRNLWEQCQTLSRQFVGMQCLALSQAIMQTDQIPCFVDEAQVLLDQLPNAFPSETNRSYRRSCFSALVKSVMGVCAGPLMAGTGIRMAAATNETGTAIGGKSSTTDVVYGRRGHLTPAACEAYILKYLNFEHDEAEPNHVSASELQVICRTLQGRPRFTERFVSLCLIKSRDTPVLKVFHDYVSTQVTGVPAPDTVPQRLSKISIYYALNELVDRLASFKRAKKALREDLARIVLAFKRAAFRYAMTGQEQILHEPSHAQLVEFGLANVSWADNKRVVAISEPIVVRAASHYFGLLAYQQNRLVDLLGDLSALGNEFEAFVALTLFDKRPFELSDDAHININRVGIPDAFVGKWKLWYPQEALTTGVLGCNSRQDGDFERFLGNDPHCAFLFPDTYAGSDVNARVCEAEAETRRLQVSIQVKFRKKVADSGRAIATTDPELMFMRRDGTSIKTRKEVRKRVLQAYHKTGLPLLRILVVYPGIAKNQASVQVVGDNELVLVIDQRNAEAVFDRDALQLLNQVHNASLKRNEEPQEAATIDSDESEQQSRKRAASPSASSSSRPVQRSARARHTPNRCGHF